MLGESAAGLGVGMSRIRIKRSKLSGKLFPKRDALRKKFKFTPVPLLIIFKSS